MENISDEKPFEVLLTSDSVGQVCNTCAWDPVTGSSLHQWKGGTSIPHSLSLVGSDYLLSGQPNKPLLNLWQVNRSEQVPIRMFTPGPVSALAVSPSGNYLAVSVQENINIWQVGTGALLSVLSRHYQPVSVIKFTRDGSHLVSGGEDGQVLVWSLVQCVARRTLPGQEKGEVGQVEPRYTWTDHSLPITDIHCGICSSGPFCRVFTVSLDQVCRVYSMIRGEQLLAVSFPQPLTALAVDNMETTVYVGTKAGTIHTFSLLAPPRDISVTVDRLDNKTLPGHKESITALSLSMDSLTLASGSEDQTVVLWDTASGQSVRSLSHKGSVVCVKFIPTPPALLRGGDNWNPARKLVSLQKGLGQDVFQCNILRKEDCGEAVNWKSQNHINMVSSGDMKEEDEDFTIKELKEINNQLYKFALKKVLS